MTANPNTYDEPSSSEQGNSIHFLDLLKIILENLRLLIITPLFAGVIALAISFLLKPSFTANTRFLPPQQPQSAAASMLQSLGALGGLAGAATGLKNPNDQFISFLKSRTIGDTLVEDFKLMERYDSKFRQGARERLAQLTTISAGKDNLITVSFEDKNPEFAAAVANAYPRELEKLVGRLALTEAQLRRSFFEKQLASTKKALTSAQQNLAASGVSASALNLTPQTALESTARLKALVTAQEVRIASMRSYLTDSAPDVRQALSELQALRAQLKKAEQEQPANKNDDAYIANLREYKYQEALFELFSKQFEIARIDESRDGASIQIIDPAIPPERPSRPKKAVIAIATSLITGFSLLIFLFLRHWVRIASKDPGFSNKLQELAIAWKRTARNKSTPN